MILVGNIIKQTKEIVGFNYIGENFEVTDVKGTNVAFKGRMGVGVMTIDELNEYFEKVVIKPQWSEWMPDKIYMDHNYVYRIKSGIIQYKDVNSGTKVQSRCMKCDEFKLQTGLEICRLKMRLKKF